MNLFEPSPDLKVGHVVEVSGTSIRVELDGKISELTRSLDGKIYPIGQIGSIVKIHFGRKVIFGFVTLLRMRSEEMASGQIGPEADQRIMEVDLFAEAIWSGGNHKLDFSRGVSTYPLPLQIVYLVTKAESAALYKAAEGRFDAEGDPMVDLGTYIGSGGTKCRINIDKAFGLHCAVLGSTGSGKSATVAAILHSLLEFKAGGQSLRPRIIMIDPHGEYGSAFGARAKIFRAYDPIGSENGPGEPVALPYWLMSADEFRSLVIGKTEHEATSQHNIVYKALTHARMVAAGLIRCAPKSYQVTLPANGSPLEEPVPLPNIEAIQIASFDRDKPKPFLLNEFENHIRYSQAIKGKNGVSEPISDSDFSSKGFRSVLDKLSVLRADSRIKFLMEEWTQKSLQLAAILSQFVGSSEEEGGPAADLRIIDISGLPNEVAGPLAAAIARLLFQYKLHQSTTERKSDPILLVCEEAHRYVPDKGEAQYAEAQSAVRRIAREGRKYGLGLMLVSQRPADIEGTVISQCNTWIVLRLTNSTDHQQVARFLPDNLSGMTKALAALARQEALFVGEGAALPARIRIRTLKEEQCPKSSDISFAQGWSQNRMSMTQLESIADRLAKTAVAKTGMPQDEQKKVVKIVRAKPKVEEIDPF